jgi:hypothetical protein
MLETKFLQDFSQNNNVSKLTTDARGADKDDCISEMGGMVAINSFLQQVKLNAPQHPAAPTTSTFPATTSPTSTTQTSQQPQSSNPLDDIGNTFVTGVKTVGYRIFLIVLILVGARILFHLIKRALRYGYAFFNSHRLVFLKVLLPRGDGKSDREQEKEIAKDMKEKI